MGIIFSLKSSGGKRHLGKTLNTAGRKYDFNLIILLWYLNY